MNARSLGYVLVLLFLVYLFLRYVLSYVMPFALGLFIAFLLEPFVSFLVNRVGLKRSWSAFLTVTAALGLCAYLVSLGLTRIFSEVAELYRYFPDYYAQVQGLIESVLKYAGEVSGRLPRPLQLFLQDQWNRVYESLAAIVSGAGGVLRSLPGVVVTALFTLLSAYFLLRDRARLSEFLRGLVPPRLFQTVRNVEMDILRGLAAYIRVQTFLIGVTVLINTAGLSIVGTRYAAVLGVILAVLDLLPVVGPGAIYVPWIVYEFVWGSVSRGLALIALYGGVSVMRQIAQTHLVGKELGLHPLETLISLYVGYKLFGAAGLVYGPLVAILLKGLWRSGVIPR